MNGIVLLIFIIGLISLILQTSNIINLLIAVEILYLACNFNFFLASVYLSDSTGFVYCLFGLALAGAEVAIGLSLIILIYRVFGDIFLANLQNIKS